MGEAEPLYDHYDPDVYHVYYTCHPKDASWPFLSCLHPTTGLSLDLGEGSGGHSPSEHVFDELVGCTPSFHDSLRLLRS
jgi:hypothetical protein